MEWIGVVVILVLFLTTFFRMAIKAKPKKKITRKELYSKVR